MATHCSVLAWSPGDLPDPEIEPGSPTLQADALLSEPPGKPVDYENGPGVEPLLPALEFQSLNGWTGRGVLEEASASDTAEPWHLR